MTSHQSNFPRLWRDIAAKDDRDQLSAALAELQDIDCDIDYSYQQSMCAIALDHGRDVSPEIGRLDEERIALRGRKYEILARLFGQVGERK